MLAVDGGEASRLTFWGNATTKVLGWADEDTVLVASSAGEDNARQTYVKAVHLDGRVDPRSYGLAGGLALHADGAVAVSTPGSRAPAAWKRYRGGTASKLWVSATGETPWLAVQPEVRASLVSPGWLGDRVLFASDLEAEFPDRADGQANLYSVDRNGGDLIRHTRHTAAEGYVRDPATDGRRVVYHARGSIFRLESLDAQPQPVDLRLGSAGSGRRPRLLKPTENLEQVRPDHTGDARVVAPPGPWPPPRRCGSANQGCWATRGWR